MGDPVDPLVLLVHDPYETPGGPASARFNELSTSLYDTFNSKWKLQPGEDEAAATAAGDAAGVAGGEGDEEKSIQAHNILS